MNVIAAGAFTAFLGCNHCHYSKRHQKGLAYSTISQLGYMVMAMGVGAYSGLFLMTHAYFKTMLFLGSGSVIHGMEESSVDQLAQDMRNDGGCGICRLRRLPS